jgi:hypothetical protein
MILPGRLAKAPRLWLDTTMNSVNEDGPYFIPLRGGRDRSSASGAANSAQPVGKARKLTLSRVPKDRDGDWSADDYDVFDGNQHVGRIVLTTQAPQGMPWSWTITARPDSAQNRGFAVSLEQAMRELTARWVNPSRV